MRRWRVGMLDNASGAWARCPVANASACCWPRPDPEPQLLVLDEPMSALDEAGIQVFEQLLHGWRQAGTTVLWIEHDLKPLRLADRVTG
jgi:ABC-type cobalamin transport system ATPase subunit